MILHFFNEIEMVERAAVAAFRGGWAGADHWDTLAECRDMLWFGASAKAKARAKSRHKSDHDAVLRLTGEAKATLLSIYEREQRLGKIDCTADELNVLHALVETSRDFWVRQSSRLFIDSLAKCEASMEKETRIERPTPQRSSRNLRQEEPLPV